VQTSHPRILLFGAGYWGKPEEVPTNPGQEFAKTFTSRNNVFFQADPGPAFLSTDTSVKGTNNQLQPTLTWEQFRTKDPTSHWKKISTAELDKLDPLKGTLPLPLR
jgi:hypothetical protein